MLPGVGSASATIARYTNSLDGDFLQNHGFANFWVINFSWGAAVNELPISSLGITPNTATNLTVVTAPQPILGVAIQDMLGRTYGGFETIPIGKSRNGCFRLGTEHLFRVGERVGAFEVCETTLRHPVRQVGIFFPS